MKKILTFFLSSLLLFSACDSTPTGAYTAIQNGGEWFLNNQDENFLYYQYYPDPGTHTAKHHVLREMASMWAITELGDFLDDSRYDELAKRGFDYFSQDIVYEEDYAYIQPEGEDAKLAYNAFMILALLNMEDVEGRDELLEAFALGLVHQQEEDDGGFRTNFNNTKHGSEDYYPGEALLALMTYYESTGNSIYLDTVTKALPYYQNHFNTDAATAFVPWQTQAYYKYYQVLPSEEVSQYIFDMNDYLIEDYGGCHSLDFSRGIVTGVYIEGMNKAYALAAQLGDSRASCYKRFVQRGSEAIMALQFPKEGQDPANFKEAALGGFYGDKNNGLHQVDRNQHAVMALMGAYELGLVK